MRCASCGTENPTDSAFCEQCGRRLEQLCPACKAPVSTGARFCRKCGTSLSDTSMGSEGTATGSSSEAGISLLPQSAADVMDGERKTVTALFADLKGSTELIRDLDPENARAIIDPALKVMVDAVQHYGGYVVQSTGDGIFALFGAPLAHEDHPQRALYAALRIQQALQQLAERLSLQGKPSLQVRVGVNSGEVVMRAVETGGRAEYTPVGYVTNLAARLQTVAVPGGIVVSEATGRLIEGYFELRPLGPTRIKGVDELINIFEVLGAGPSRTHFQVSARRGLTRFAGRDRELAELKRAFELAGNGRGQIAAIVAEAGAGKSRLVHESKATLPPSCKVLEAYSVSHGRASAWLPLLELMRSYFGFRESDDGATRREKVRAALTALDPELSDLLPYLLALLGVQHTPDPLAQMDPQIRRQRTLDALKRILVRESLNQPVVLIFEDLHWIDVESQAFLDVLADSISNLRALLLVSYRPEYRHSWSNRSYYSQLRLNTLEPEDAQAMLSALLGISAELDPIKRLIIERTEGNPFFIEEMVQALFDEGVLARDGAVKVTRSLAQLRLPPTVQGVLAARIDRLPPDRKQLLQTLAVIGRVSALAIIRQLASSADSKLSLVLTDLQASEFIYERQASSEVQYLFKHALTQEVAYSSILIERRKLFHELTARAIEEIFASNLIDHYSELARHYSLSNNAEKAFDYLRLAGEQAVQRSANTEAAVYFKSALQLLLNRPDTPQRAAQELDLQIALGPVLQATMGWAAPDVERACSRVLALCQQLGESPQIYSAIFGLQAFYVHRGKLRRALELAEQGLNLAQNLQDPGLVLQAHHMMAYNLAYLGELTEAREHAQQGIALYDPKYHSLAFSISGDDPGVCCFCFQALALWTLGYPDQALRSVCDAISLAEKVSHPLSLALALTFASIVHQMRREREAVEERADACIRLSIDQGFTFFLALGKIMRGWALAQRGEADGVRVMHEGLSAYRATGADSFRPYHLALIVEGHKTLAHADKALDTVSDAFSWMEHADERLYEPELYRLKGTLVLQSAKLSGDSRSSLTNRGQQTANEAETCFRKAIDAARRQKAKSHELRATTNLARLLGDGDDRSEALDLLATIYNWFTEGFDTADLKEARALLDELSV
jgi:class 3 adenylate cyclase/tetratricopeptide (TPR) repeat protein